MIMCPRCGKKPLMKDGKTAGGKQRWCCATHPTFTGNKVYCYSTTNPTAKPRNQAGRTVPNEEPQTFQRKLRKGTRRFLITAAQNATPVQPDFWAALQHAAKHLSAEILVVPTRYKNPTSQWSESQENAEHWSPKVMPFLWNVRMKLNQNLALLADVKVQPTAVRPLSGFEALTGRESFIIGHTKVQALTVPTPANKMAKLGITTGACTVKNYSDSKAGSLGAFHHTLGALLVEIDGKEFYIRQLLATSDGSFIDLNTLYTSVGVKKAQPALALVMGDLHYRFLDPGVKHATFGKGGIIDTLDPQHLVFHDSCDGYSVNPHDLDDPFITKAKRDAGFNLVRQEVEATIAFVNSVTGTRKAIIVDSNHDDFLRRWVIRTDWRQDVDNAAFYFETAQAMLADVKMGPGGAVYGSPFAHWVEKLSLNPGVRCLKQDESFSLEGVELGLHGDRGPNGSRGSRENLKRIGTKSIIGHAHSPGVSEGCWQAGTSSALRLSYAKGPSSWLHCHVALYSNGKRSLIIIVNGHWKL
jgi:hypothetical protein